MQGSTRLVLVGATASAHSEREHVADLPDFTRDARGVGFLYAAEERACVELAAHLGDRLWLAPRRQLSLGRPRALLELVQSHRYECVVAVVPAASLAANVEALQRAVAARVTQRAQRVIELSFSAPLQTSAPELLGAT